MTNFFQIKKHAAYITGLSEKLSPSTKTSNVTRAVITYLPPNMDGYLKEFKALFLSVAVMRATQPETIKTDFVVFTPKESLDIPLSLGCLEEFRLI
jgi:hypothetical protein